ncbi:MAG: nucleotidyl transferase AbiEii/AbiGii toxin family protein [Bacteriovoracia bacterium]
MKSKGDSIRQRLANLSAQRKVQFSNLETAFLLERLVARIVATPSLQSAIVFKGGFVSLTVYDSPRYTIDLDALLVKSNLEKTLTEVKSAAETDISDGVWFHFESQIDLKTQGEYGGVRQVYRAGLGEKLKNLSKAQVINFDLGIGDPVTPGPRKLKIKSLLSDEELSWSVYPVETIIAEKIHALIANGDFNSRSKDVYDLSIFLDAADPKILAGAIQKTFKFRETQVPKSIAVDLLALRTDRLEKGWKSATASVANAPSFLDALHSVISKIRQIEAKF